ncbi:Phenazine biosynthesis PhzF protein [Sesbania bispinosa]|nr:Phenazine biosynthesis PhzF protein [Sesbania bispinosa]
MEEKKTVTYCVEGNISLIIRPLGMSLAKKAVKYSVVDAFSKVPFMGNPAAVCFLDNGRDEDNRWMKGVAAEINLLQTCFLIRLPGTSVLRFRLRCFSPLREVKVCAHTLIAAAHLIFSCASEHIDSIDFVTISGVQTAKKIPTLVTAHENSHDSGFCVELDYPVDPVDPDIEFNEDEIAQISMALFGASIIDVKKTQKSGDLLVEVSSGENVIEIKPQMDAITKCPGRGIILTGRVPPGSGFDFYSRFFCPEFRINEDHVTGSSHCALAPYWSKKLGKCDLNAIQVSPRGGVLSIIFDEEKQRVFLRGKAVTVMGGHIMV